MDTCLMSDISAAGGTIKHLVDKNTEIDEELQKKADRMDRTIVAVKDLSVEVLTTDLQFDPWDVTHMTPAYHIPVPSAVRILNLQPLRPECVFLAQEMVDLWHETLDEITILGTKQTLLTGNTFRSIPLKCFTKYTLGSSTTVLAIQLDPGSMPDSSAHHAADSS